MAKVCVDPGHGGVKSGAVFQGLMEKDVTLAVSLELKSLLSENHEVVMTREYDNDVSLSERCTIANNSKCDIFVSIHCNADPDDDSPGNPEAKGEEIWFKNGSDESYKLAESLASYMDLIFPDEKFRGIKGTDDLYVLNGTKMPAVLIEIGFIDKTDSVEKFSDPFVIEEIAQLIYQGIEEYLG